MRNALALWQYLEIFENKKIYWLRRLASAVLMGTVGTLLVTLFLTTFLPLARVAQLLPFIIAFNAAMTGYSLLDKSGAALQHRYVFATCAGLLNALLTCSALVGLCVYALGQNLFGSGQLFLFFAIATVCSELGAGLAVRQNKIRLL